MILALLEHAPKTDQDFINYLNWISNRSTLIGGIFLTLCAMVLHLGKEGLKGFREIRESWRAFREEYKQTTTDAADQIVAAAKDTKEAAQQVATVATDSNEALRSAVSQQGEMIAANHREATVFRDEIRTLVTGMSSEMKTQGDKFAGAVDELRADVKSIFKKSGGFK